MRAYDVRHPLLVFVLLIICGSSGMGQAQDSGTGEAFHALPSSLDRHSAALGDRLRKPGKERTTLTGTLVGESGIPIPLRVILQWPGLVRLEGLRPNSVPVTFDGRASVLTHSRVEEQLLEIFSSDSADGMIVAAQGGAAIQLLGRRVADATLHNRNGQRQDIFEVSSLLQWSPREQERLKRYYFDSDSGLLTKTQYLDETFSPPVLVETAFTEWSSVEGSFYPTRVERHENGRLAFSFVVTSIVAAPRLSPTTFATHPNGTQEK